MLVLVPAAFAVAMTASGAGRVACGTFTNGEDPPCEGTNGPDNFSGLGGNDHIEGCETVRRP